MKAGEGLMTGYRIHKIIKVRINLREAMRIVMLCYIKETKKLPLFPHIPHTEGSPTPKLKILLVDAEDFYLFPN